LAERALPHALQMAQCMGSELHLARVTLAMLYVDGPGTAGPAFTQQMLDSDREAAQTYLGRLQQRLNCPDLPVVTTVLEGPVAEVLVDYARAHRIDLIVMSTHGRSGLSRWVFGSVAERVLRGAHCPTLVVRGTPAPDTADRD
jgi:nucleotide-binding universal stress UspA family protein